MPVMHHALLAFRAAKNSGALASSARGFASSSEPPVYLVFGATGGIGSELSRILQAQPDAKVILSSRSDSKLKELADKIGGGTTMACNVLNPKEVEEMVQQISKEHGRIDGVANCVGSFQVKPGHLVTPEEFDDVLTANLKSSFNILRSSVKNMMKTGGGSICFTTSAVAHHGYANHEAIAAAKAGVGGLIKSAAATYAKSQIRCNAVAPGLIATPGTVRFTKSDAAREVSEKMHALGRIGQPGDVARAMSFLLHPDNSFITGQILGIDGGLANVAPLTVSK